MNVGAKQENNVIIAWLANNIACKFKRVPYITIQREIDRKVFFQTEKNMKYQKIKKKFFEFHEFKKKQKKAAEKKTKYKKNWKLKSSKEKTCKQWNV